MLNCIVAQILSERKPLVCRGFISRSPPRVNVLRSRAREECLDPCHRTPRDGRTEQLLRNDRSRTGTESRAGPRARADVKEVADWRVVTRLRREGTPEEVLVERKRAAVGIAPLEVTVGGLQIRRTERDSPEDRAREVRGVARDPGLDPVGVALAEFIRPRAVF